MASRTGLVCSTLLTGIWLSGCATMTRGSHERVSIHSNPVGATVVTTIKAKTPQQFDDGTQSEFLGCAPTPCTINIPRASSPVITVNKDGYQAIKFKLVSSWATAAASLRSGSIVAGVPPGSHVVAGRPDALKRIPIQGTVFWSGLFTYGLGPVIDATTGANKSLSPNPVTIYLAADNPESTK